MKILLKTEMTTAFETLRPGNVVDLDDQDAYAAIQKGFGIPLSRVTVKRPVLIGTHNCIPGDVVEVHPEEAAWLVRHKDAVDAVKIELTRDLKVDDRHHAKGKVIVTTNAVASDCVVAGHARYA